MLKIYQVINSCSGFIVLYFASVSAVLPSALTVHEKALPATAIVQNYSSNFGQCGGDCYIKVKQDFIPEKVLKQKKRSVFPVGDYFFYSHTLLLFYISNVQKTQELKIHLQKISSFSKQQNRT